MNPYDCLTIVIYTYNEERRILEILNYYKLFKNIIISDNISTDKTLEIVRKNFPNVIIINNTEDDYISPKRIIAANNIVTTEWVFHTVVSERLPHRLIDEIIKRIVNKKYQYKAIKVYRQSYTSEFPTHTNRMQFKRFIINRYYPNSNIYIKKYFNSKESRIHQEFTLTVNWDQIDIISPKYRDFEMTHIRSFEPSININKILEYSKIDSQRRIADGQLPSILKLLLKPPLTFIYYSIRDPKSLTSPIGLITNICHGLYYFFVEYWLIFLDKRNK